MRRWFIQRSAFGASALCFVVRGVGGEPLRIGASKGGGLSAVCAGHEVLTLSEREDREEEHGEPGSASVQALRRGDSAQVAGEEQSRDDSCLRACSEDHHPISPLVSSEHDPSQQFSETPDLGLLCDAAPASNRTSTTDISSTVTRKLGCDTQSFGAQFAYEHNQVGGSAGSVSASFIGGLSVGYSGSPATIQKSTNPTYINF
ncbi:hypothetical protein G9U53_33025 [Rhodococcus sp. D-46]|uniref:hypothetical protein n=1 Tax=Rhodococcus TaxID=1827 RepID=UPI0013F660EE|nr:hypothetical protein [Rhodococcus qingshengii]NHE69123.1 hypothetical protein [Rhodococcus sp. D-46]QXC46571.1 hypothetical protein KSE96_30475 [Rhodococcus qingshengii]